MFALGQRSCGSLLVLACAALASLVGATACAPAPTQLVVVVDTDLQVPAQLREVALTVSSPERGLMESEREPIASASALPLTLGVSTSGEFLGPIEVVARGARDGTVVVERRARVTLVRGETRMLRLDLLARCFGVACEAGESCGESGCAPIEIDDLPPWPGSPPRLGDDAGVPDADAGAWDAAMPDGAMRDAAMLDAAMSDAAVCDGSIESCGCRGDFDCPPGSEGPWGACEYPDMCTEAGSRSRMVRTHACVDGACVPTDHDETEPCDRDTDGERCGSTSCGDYGTCSYPSTCAELGEQSRTCSDLVCSVGACQTVTRSETAECTRDTHGTSCGASSACRLGSCVSCAPTLSGAVGTVGASYVKGVTGSGSMLTIVDGSTGAPAGNISAPGVSFSGSGTAALCIWQVLGMGDRVRFVEWNGIDSFDVMVSGASVSGSSAPPCLPSEYGCFPPCAARVVGTGSTLRVEHTDNSVGTLTFGCP